MSARTAYVVAAFAMVLCFFVGFRSGRQQERSRSDLRTAYAFSAGLKYGRAACATANQVNLLLCKGAGIEDVLAARIRCGCGVTGR